MIQADQPTCFSDDVVVKVSSTRDGTMLDRERDFHAEDVVENRETFCLAAGISYDNVAYQLIEYGSTQTYDVITEVTKADTHSFQPHIAGDALVTYETGVGLFLPVADCVPTVVFDPHRRMLAVLHLGRHASYAKLVEKFTLYCDKAGCDPVHLKVWMGPHASKHSYRLSWFDRASDPDWNGFYKETAVGTYLDLAGYNRQLFERAGVLPENIVVSDVDTAQNEEYFSHSSGDVGGRIAVLAYLKAGLPLIKYPAKHERSEL